MPDRCVTVVVAVPVDTFIDKTSRFIQAPHTKSLSVEVEFRRAALPMEQTGMALSQLLAATRHRVAEADHMGPIQQELRAVAEADLQTLARCSITVPPDMLLARPVARAHIQQSTGKATGPVAAVVVPDQLEVVLAQVAEQALKLELALVARA